VTRKRRRLYVLLAGMLAVGAATALTLTAFQDNLVFFYSPTDVKTKAVPDGRRIRVGGLVEAGVSKDGTRTTFSVTDTSNSITITYVGLLPDLFREGQGIVAQGRFGKDGVFEADEVLAKHDEKYMPPEVADALKRSGQWKPESQ